ncbi:MAG TPA: uroporphyrinogen-III synthase [Planctomycetaceae bacterium]|nr:uroporphyrinogen-III synthase [Planctomycetaceae bacterium]
MLRVCSFESRRAPEMRSLIERQGAAATVVPSMREVPLESNGPVFAFAQSLLAGQFDVVVLLTGVGARALLDAAATRFDREQILAALRRVTIAVRGPKPAAVLREWAVPFAIRAQEPNTWRELLAAMESAGAIDSKRIAVQEYGRPSWEFVQELILRGAAVEQVPVYRWALPEDLDPLRLAIRQTIAGKFNVLLFTSANQLDSVLEVAASLGQADMWLIAARRCVIGSIGPTASEAIRERGLPVDVEAVPTRMGQLVGQTLEAAPKLLAVPERYGR